MHRVNTTERWPVKIWASLLEATAEAQALNLAKLPFIHKHVALMPDAHAGKGSTIGAVIATKGAIMPSCVGVDIGCGMSAMCLNRPLDAFGGSAKLRALRDAIEQVVPVGQSSHQKMDDARSSTAALAKQKFNVEDRVAQRAGLQLGTLGGGNHFIELCGDEAGTAWVVLHSGSRYLGKHLADLHIGKAKGLMKAYFVDLPDPDLAYLAEGTDEFAAYISDMQSAQEYARANRAGMMGEVMGQVAKHLGFEHPVQMGNLESIDCHHNYTTREHHFGANVWVTRKGAVCARKGVKGIIPGSMGTQSFIVEGLGNADSFDSCAHGAGRAMSRTEA
ncbi:MAG: RtcB family protein, partial [Janthinobacterium lividum]